MKKSLTTLARSHSLAYGIECHERAEISEQLAEEGHSNWLEASHNVLQTVILVACVLVF